MSEVNASTPLLKLSTGAYPRYLRDVRVDPDFNITFGPVIDSETLLDVLGYAVVHRSEKPTGDVVVEGNPIRSEEDNEFYQNWIVRDYTPEELAENLATAKMIKLAEIESCLTVTETNGIPHPFDSQDGTGTRVLHVSMSIDNRMKLLGSAVCLDNTTGTLNYRIRVIENETIMLDRESASALLVSLFSTYDDILGEIWDMQDAVNRAQTISELPEVPISVI